MAAPSIPNLLTTMRGRGRGRGGRGPGADRGRRPAASSSQVSPDVAIQGTDTDAAVSRLSAVDLGYLDDAYAKLFVSGPPTRRLPIINRGTFVRTTSLDIMITAFLSHHDYPSSSQPRQIISLGAGTDTRPLHLLQKHNDIIYHEFDFEPTCRRKLAITQSSPDLRRVFKDFSIRDDGSWSADARLGGEYHCHALDLRRLAELPSTVRAHLPTLVLSECCLCYLTRRDAENVLRVMTSNISHIAALLYEPMPLHDAFGDMMISNLRARQIHMPSLDEIKDQDGQLSRLRDVGFDHVGSVTIERAWDEWLDGSEKDRVDALQGLDEMEEWKLLAAHYLVAWATRGASFAPRQHNEISYRQLVEES